MNTRRQKPKTRQAPVPSLCKGPKFFDAELLDEEEAARVYHRCIKALDVSSDHGQTSGEIKLGHRYSQIHALYNSRRLVRFWLRTVVDNRLVMVGNHSGLLPLDVEPIHGR